MTPEVIEKLVSEQGWERNQLIGYIAQQEQRWHAMKLHPPTFDFIAFLSLKIFRERLETIEVWKWYTTLPKTTKMKALASYTEQNGGSQSLAYLT